MFGFLNFFHWYNLVMTAIGILTVFTGWQPDTASQKIVHKKSFRVTLSDWNSTHNSYVGDLNWWYHLVFRFRAMLQIVILFRACIFPQKKNTLPHFLVNKAYCLKLKENCREITVLITQVKHAGKIFAIV